MGNHLPFLADRLRLYDNDLTAVAKSWIALGALALIILEGDRPLWQFPEDAESGSNFIALPLGDFGLCLAVSFPGGHEYSHVEARLQADAALLARLLQLETELEHMTTAVIDYQDQLLTLDDLHRSLRHHLTIPEVLSTVARLSQQILAVSGVCAVTTQGKDLFSAYASLDISDDCKCDFLNMVIEGQRRIVTSDPVLGNIMVVTVEVRGGKAGLIIADRKRTFASPDIKLAEAIAEQAGAHLDNVLLHQETLAQARLQTEMELARQVQNRLLPRRAPKVHGLDVYGAALPAREVGGDFYDFLSAQPRFVFAVGDVSGKGLSAAMVMAMLHAALRSAANLANATAPYELTARLNAELYDDFTELDVFATAFIGAFEPENDTLTFANAGHSPVIYYSPGQVAHLLEADGTAIGVLPESFCEHQTIKFPVGAVLIAATDGLAEASNSTGEMFGYDRLLRLAEQTAHVSAEEIAAQFLEAVKDFQAQQDDDQTILVVKRRMQ
jgi:phosphoserine phosphatase RsbU/P